MQPRMAGRGRCPPLAFAADAGKRRTQGAALRRQAVGIDGRQNTPCGVQPTDLPLARTKQTYAASRSFFDEFDTLDHHAFDQSYSWPHRICGSRRLQIVKPLLLVNYLQVRGGRCDLPIVGATTFKSCQLGLGSKPVGRKRHVGSEILGGIVGHRAGVNVRSFSHSPIDRTTGRGAGRTSCKRTTYHQSRRTPRLRPDQQGDFFTAAAHH